MREEKEARAAVLAAAKGMLGHRLTSGTSGNVSARLDGGTLVITPSGVPYQDMGPGDLVVITMAGEPVSPGAVSPGATSPGPRGLVPSSEYQLHTACYQAFPEIGAVLHSHPPYASMFAAAREPVPAVIDEAVIFLGGDIPAAPYAISGSAGVGANAVAMLAARASALLANHGLVTIAATRRRPSTRPWSPSTVPRWPGACGRSAGTSRCPPRPSKRSVRPTAAPGSGSTRPGSARASQHPAQLATESSTAARRARLVAARMASTRTAPTTTPMATAQPSASAIPTAGSSGSFGGSLPVTLVQATVATLRATKAAPRAATVLIALVAPSPRLSAMHPP